MSWVNINICVSPYKSKNWVPGFPSWSAQADSPGTALAVEKEGGQSSALGEGQFWHNPFITKEKNYLQTKGSEMPFFSLGQCFFLHWVLTLNSRLQIEKWHFSLLVIFCLLAEYIVLLISVSISVSRTTLTRVAWAALKPYLESKSRDSASSLVCLMMKRSARPSSGICK